MKNLVDGINLSHYAFSESEKNFQDDLIANSMTSFHRDGSNLTITFLSLNRAALSIRLLDSIQIFLPDFKGKILILDNGSEAAELDKLKAFVSEMKLPVKIYETNKNLGIAGGRNKAAELIETDWFLSLDNDVYFIDDPLDSIKDCIEKLGVHFLNLPLFNSDGHTIFTLGGNLTLRKYKDSYEIGCLSSFRKGLKSEVALDHPFLSTCLFGTAAVLRTKSFIEQGGFDENLFVGFEDIDFSIKLYKEGIKIGNANKFCAIHGHEAPSNLTDVDYEKIRFSQENIRKSGEYFHAKHNVYAWTEGVGEWIVAREEDLELKNGSFEFSNQTKIHNQNKLKHLNLNSKTQNDLPRIALIVDIENWAHHHSAQQICQHLGESYNFQIFTSSSYENLGYLMLDVQDFDLIHIFWRADLFNLLNDSTERQFAEQGWNYEDFLTNVIAKANITFSVCDHLFLKEDEVKQKNILFSALSAGYIVISEKLSRIYSSIADYPKPNFLIENGVDLELFAPSNPERFYKEGDEIVIGWAGNSKWGGDGIDHKGLETIIKPAIESLRAEGYKVRGDYADRMERWIPHNEMNDYYNSIDIYVCASEDFEGTPNPVMEAMACGLPVISTDVGVVPQLFGALQQNYILPSRTVEQLKTKLIELIEDSPKRRLLSQENLESIKNWTWKKKSENWDEFFKSMLFISQEKHIKERQDFLRKQNLKMYLSLNSNQESIRDLENKVEELQTALDSSENHIVESARWNAELQAALGNSQSRITELDDWTVQLQTLLRNSEKRIAELDDWTVELQTVLGNSENRISELGKLIEELESDLLQANKQSEDAKLQIEDAKLQNEELRLKLETTENVVAAMEASKFWKLRNHWFKLKDSLPTNSKQT